MRLRSHGISVVGRVREGNEDAYSSDDRTGFYVVADGVGGRAKGEVASHLAVEEALLYVRRQRPTPSHTDEHPRPEEMDAARRLLETAIQHACYMVHGMGEDDPEHHGMSTTVSSMLVLDEVTAILGQVGDSRIYRYRAGETEQLTEDHTLINYNLKHGLITKEEAATSPDRNVITRAVGHRDYVQVDTFFCDLQEGDRYLLCSDGLHGYMDVGEVGYLLGEGPIPDAARRLVDLANERGGKDNITALVVECSKRPVAQPASKKPPLPDWQKEIKKRWRR